MTSSDGINWTTRTSAADNQWYSVTYGNGLFVAVSLTGSGNRVMTGTTQVAPTLGPFTIPTQVYGDSPFTITPPTSNSDGSFSYSSSNTAVATISNDIITITGVGSSTITATQAATTNYFSATTTTTFTVVSNSESNPVVISSNEQLVYFLNSTAIYCNIIADITVTENLFSLLGTKIITNNSSQNVKISR